MSTPRRARSDPASPSRPDAGPQTADRRVRVLHVEDSATTRLQVRTMLERAGIEVVSAATGGEGLRRASEDEPDVVLLDVQLPDMDGFEVCRRLKSRPDTALVPVAHLSETFNTTGDRVRGIENGADWYLTQPVEPVELVSTIRALARLHVAEEGVRVQAADLAAILATTTDGVWWLGHDARLLDVNDAYCLMSGYARDELLTMSVSDIEARDAPQFLAGRIDEVMTAGFARFESRHLRKDGAVADVEITVSSRREIDQLLLFVRDISERKRNEQYVRRLAAVVESSDDAIITKNLDGTIMTWNAGAERLYGYPAAEAVGQPIGLLAPPERNAELSGIMERLRRGDRFDTLHLETVRLRKNGEQVDVSLSVSPLRDDAGRVTGATSVARDISATRRAAAEIRALNEELEARVAARTAELENANKSLEAFTYSASHDLRAPLQTVIGFSAALLEDCGHTLDDLGRRYAERIRSAGENMARLIDDLLDFSCADRVAMHADRVNLSAEVADIAEGLRRREPDRQVRFVIEPAVHATADRGLIRTVLENLLGNAWKFTSVHREAVIEFATMPVEGGAVCCYVRDDGAGFDPGLAGRLFQPFQRLHTARQFPGTGIGLASVQRIVERHGGRAWADGEVGQGATVYFTLALSGPAGENAIGEAEHPLTSLRPKPG